MTGVRSRLWRFFEKAAYKRRLELVDEVLKAKQSVLLEDEGGQTFPINISVIIPTFLKDKSELSGYRYEVIRNELMVLSQLITNGLIDEVVIVDGSRTPEGQLDETLAQRIIATAYRILPLFHEQVDLLNKFPVLKDRAKLGLYDFVFKVFHQLDSNIQNAAEKAGLKFTRIPAGKGSGLWLATAVASGDLLVYLDSDIRNLEEWQIASLVMPILQEYKNPDGVEFVKAYYARLAVNLDSPERGFYELGGRVTRLFMIPFLKALNKRGVLKGLDKIRYPLAGEFSARRRFIESLSFPGDYGVESGLLIDIWKKKMLDKVSEADLHIYQHFPRSDAVITDMAAQVIKLILSELNGSAKIDERIVDEYLSEAYKELERTYELFDRLEVKLEVSQSVRRTFYRDVDKDRMRIKSYEQTLRNMLKSRNSLRKAVLKLPPWKEVTASLEGRNFQNYLRRRAVTYTFQLLSKQRLTSYD
ncbi:MAG: hypothetical protein QXE22_00585 [Candidatus Bathyarchaeia archaeon]